MAKPLKFEFQGSPTSFSRDGKLNEVEVTFKDVLPDNLCLKFKGKRFDVVMTEVRESTDCQECKRRDLLEWLQEFYYQVPMPDDTGFGKHEEWVQGMLDGIGQHIKGIISSLKELEKEGLTDGSIYGEVEKNG